MGAQARSIYVASVVPAEGLPCHTAEALNFLCGASVFGFIDLLSLLLLRSGTFLPQIFAGIQHIEFRWWCAINMHQSSHVARRDELSSQVAHRA